jgi:hypothetical protein
MSYHGHLLLLSSHPSKAFRPSSNRRKHGVLQRIFLHRRLGRLFKSFPIIPILLSDAILKRIIRQRLNKQVPHGIEHGANLGAGFPVFRLQQAQADVAERVVGYVGVVDAGDELERWRLEGVVGWQGEDEAEAAGVVD